MPKKTTTQKRAPVRGRAVRTAKKPSKPPVRRKPATGLGQRGFVRIAQRIGWSRSPFSNPLPFLIIAGLAGIASMFVFRSSAQTVNVSFWTNEKPAVSAVSERKAVELGLRFKSSSAGTVTGVKFYKGKGNNGTHTGSLWSANGQRLATVTFKNETSSGWQTAYFATPVQITADTLYTVSYLAPQGRYAQNTNYFAASRTSGVLTAPGNDAQTVNGVYKYGGGFPTDGNQQSNYWVDVLFSYDQPSSGVPGPVGSMVLSGATQTSLNVAWTAPVDQGGSPVTAYKIGWVETGTGRTWTSSPPHYSLADSPVTISGLTAGTSYEVQITPINLSGEGAMTTQAASTLPTTPAPGGLSANLVGGYWQMWDGPYVSEITANAPQYNLQYAAFAMGKDTNGNVAFNPAFATPDRLKTDIAASKAAGSTWLLSIGGGSDSTIRLLTETHATNMFNSLVPIIDAYGFQGIDIDIECGTSCWSSTAGASLAQKLKAKYGTNFVISAAPRPYEARSRTGIYTDFALKAGNNLDLFGLQFYDFTEARNTSQLTSIVNNDLASITSYGIPASKILIGCITYTKYQYGWNTVTVYRDIYNQQKQKYPGLRGVFVWDTAYDKLEGWNFAKVMGTAVRGM